MQLERLMENVDAAIMRARARGVEPSIVVVPIAAQEQILEKIRQAGNVSSTPTLYGVPVAFAPGDRRRERATAYVYVAEGSS